MIISRDVIFDKASKWSFSEGTIQWSTKEYLQIQGIGEEVPLGLGPSLPINPPSRGPNSPSPTLESSTTNSP